MIATTFDIACSFRSAVRSDFRERCPSEKRDRTQIKFASLGSAGQNPRPSAYAALYGFGCTGAASHAPARNGSASRFATSRLPFSIAGCDGS